jgi:hypothetical protein
MRAPEHLTRWRMVYVPTSDRGVLCDFPGLQSLLKGCCGVSAHMHVPSIPTQLVPFSIPHMIEMKGTSKP